MRILHDGPGRVVLVTSHRAKPDEEPFAPNTIIGGVFEELLGAPASTYFAVAAVLPDEQSMPRHVYGYEARHALAERYVVVVGKEAAALLDVPEEPLLIWVGVPGKRIGWREIPPLTSAAFPRPGLRSRWWLDIENVEVARQWLEELGEVG